MQIEQVEIDFNNMLKAIALVLNDPSLARKVDHPEYLVGLDSPHINLFSDVVEHFKSDENLTAGSLIESYRGCKVTHELLMDLMKWSPPIGIDLSNWFDNIIANRS